MYTRVVRETYFPQVMFPQPRMIVCRGGQHIQKGAIESLNLSITLGVVQTGARFHDPQQPADLGNHLRLKLPALIRMQLPGRQEATEELIH